MYRHFLFLIIPLLLAGPAFAQRERRERPPQPAKEIVYKQIEGRELLLHVFEPEGHKVSDERPAIVFFHGGAWRGGNPNQFFHQSAYLAQRGMWAASAAYRLTGKVDSIGVADCVVDAKDAIRYVRQHAAELGVDGQRIAAGGGSAGGHLAAATAVAPDESASGGDEVSCQPQLLVLFNPALFHRLGRGTITLDYFGRGTPPQIHFYGANDSMLQYGKDVRQRGDELGFDVRVFTAAGQGHGFFNDPPWRDQTLLLADEFLAEHGYLQGEPTLQPSQAAQLEQLR